MTNERPLPQRAQRPPRPRVEPTHEGGVPQPRPKPRRADEQNPVTFNFGMPNIENGQQYFLIEFGLGFVAGAGDGVWIGAEDAHPQISYKHRT